MNLTRVTVVIEHGRPDDLDQQERATLLGAPSAAVGIVQRADLRFFGS